MRNAQRVFLPLATAGILFAVYLLTLAPGVTFWDSGELISAVHSLGIPHPPGTPLYVLLARAWSDALGFLPRALATNLLSAACTALACGVLGWVLADSLGNRASAMAGAICAGLVSTVWLNATETEVYAPSLLLASAMLAAGHRYGRTGEARWLALASYLFALSAPLHLSALVAAPAAIAFAAQSQSRLSYSRWQVVGLLAASLLISAGVGTASFDVAAVGIILILLATVITGWRSSIASRMVLVLIVLIAGLSALAYIPTRAAHDPAINAGNASNLEAMWDVLARRQYAHPGMWPRQAPLWLQLGNLLEYADWQFALGLSNGVAPSWSRTPFTAAFALLGIVGAGAHRRADVRSWRAMLMLILCASVGLVLYMNFKAGASFGYGLIPEGSPHEARDREYFFALAFWCWGAWAGIGAVSLVSRISESFAWAGVAIAALPLVLNWHAADRRRSPEASLAALYGRALLWSVPERGVLIAGGDNDTFPVWYLQNVENHRRDVTVVVAPLLGALWYRSELARRDSLLPPALVAGRWPGESKLLDAIANAAAARNRPVVTAISAGAGRAPRQDFLALNGLAWRSYDREPGAVWARTLGAYVDTSSSRAFIERFGSRIPRAAGLRERVDHAPYFAARVLACPAEAHALSAGKRLPEARLARPDEVGVDSLDSVCKPL
ncbi:MAG: DUF2723 domain-containing protein [Gemmatimonadaceae bacterium]